MSNIDPRAYSTERLEAPHPLPAVGRKALKRVKDRLPRPTACRYCGPESRVFIASHKEVYGGRSYGSWPYVYLCDGCGAYVGIHEGTDLPIGTLANEDLRRARRDNKKHFNSVMDRFGMGRREAYQWLAGEMEIPVPECHWGWFEVGDCQKAGEICKDKLKEINHGSC